MGAVHCKCLPVAEQGFEEQSPITLLTSDVAALPVLLDNGKRRRMRGQHPHSASSVDTPCEKQREDSGAKSVEQVLADLSKIPEDTYDLATAKLQEDRLKLLCHLVRTETDGLDLIASGGCVELVLKAMGKHLIRQGLLEHGLCLLRLLAVEPRFQEQVVSLGGLETIIQGMREREANAAVQEHGCRTLFSFASNSRDNKVKIARLGGIHAVLQAMSAHGKVAAVQEAACSALRILVPDHASQKKLLDLGGVASMLQTMAANPAETHVQAQGVWALCNLAYGQREHQTKIAALGGIEAVLRAMRLHRGAAFVQEQGCRALKNLASGHPENRNLIARLSGESAVLEAMAAHASAAEVQEQACWALRNLADGSVDNTAVLVACGAVDAVCQALEMHSSELGVKIAGRTALITLAPA